MQSGRLLGVHVSISGGMHKAIERGMELGINAIQVFLKNSNQWEARPYRDDEIDNFKSAKKESGIKSIFAHSGYLINLAGKGDILKKSVRALADELKRAGELDIDYIVIHPGNHMGAGTDEGIKKISGSIDEIYHKSEGKNTGLLLETTAGQGTSVGSRFEELQRIIELSENRERLDICFDTCHVFAAGYNIAGADEYKKIFDDFDKIIGINRIKLIHLNDSKKASGSRVDRHEHFGKGFIGPKGFDHLLNDKRLKSIPLILETPKVDETSDLINLAEVRKLMKK